MGKNGTIPVGRKVSSIRDKEDSTKTTPSKKAKSTSKKDSSATLTKQQKIQGNRAASPSPKKRSVAEAAQPPFPLYRDVAKPSCEEGFEAVVNLLKGRKNIVVLTGAGISVSCGIPDFRSKGSGLYSTLDTQELGLSCAEELFDFEVFQEDPRPFFKFARNLYFPRGTTQRAQPSDSHKLLALLEQKKMLLRVYSQNIDGLEQVAGVSPKKMVYAHGSLQWATCCTCKRKVPAKEIEPAILERTVPLCQEPAKGKRIDSISSNSSLNSGRSRSPPAQHQQPTRSEKDRCRKRPRQRYDSPETKVKDTSICGGTIKPGVIFFGEKLHDTVRKSLESDRNKVDALIVMGTSLSVAPMSKVIAYMPSSIPRILINRTIVHPKTTKIEQENCSGDSDSDDEDKDFREGYVFDACLLGFCDDVTRVLAKKLFTAESPGAVDLQEQNQTPCELLADLRDVTSDDDEDEHSEGDTDVTTDMKADDEDSTNENLFNPAAWSLCKAPRDRVFLFPGAEPSNGDGVDDDDASSEVTFREIAHCDGCAGRIFGTIQKCVVCFDYDLCQECYPVLSKTHFNGEHVFESEPAAPPMDA